MRLIGTNSWCERTGKCDWKNGCDTLTRTFLELRSCELVSGWMVDRSYYLSAERLVSRWLWVFKRDENVDRDHELRQREARTVARSGDGAWSH